MEAKISRVEKALNLVITVDDEQRSFPVEKIANNIYELVDGGLIIDGLEVDIVLVINGVVTYFCETTHIEEIDDDTEIEVPEDEDDD